MSTSLAIGRMNHLYLRRRVSFGVYLGTGMQEGATEVLMPKRYVPESADIGRKLEVFVYTDSEDRPVATTETPALQAGRCAYLPVAEVNRTGAFLDWGLPKHLLVPFSEQLGRMRVGRSYVVAGYLDHACRMTASARLERHLSREGAGLRAGQAVELLICAKTDLGWQAVVDDRYLGMLFEADAPPDIKIGQRLPGRIKRIRRHDRQIDLLPERATDELEARILEDLRQHNGISNLTDDSDPEAVRARFGVSKRRYKQALGGLYKRRLIEFGAGKVRLVGGK